jgi:hypothetical protein
MKLIVRDGDEYAVAALFDKDVKGFAMETVPLMETMVGAVSFSVYWIVKLFLF